MLFSHSQHPELGSGMTLVRTKHSIEHVVRFILPRMKGLPQTAHSPALVWETARFWQSREQYFVVPRLLGLTRYSEPQ